MLVLSKTVLIKIKKKVTRDQDMSDMSRALFFMSLGHYDAIAAVYKCKVNKYINKKLTRAQDASNMSQALFCCH